MQSGAPLGHVLYGIIRLGDLPEAVQNDAELDRITALRVAVDLARHGLRPAVGHIPIGNVDAYIEKWKRLLP